MTDEQYLASIATLNTSLDWRITNAVPLPTNKPVTAGRWITDVRALPVVEPIPELTEEECEEGLTVKQTKAIQCLINGMNQQKTGEAVGVTRRAICNWIKLPAFKRILKLRRKEGLAASVQVLQSASLELATNLVKLAKNSYDPADQIRATVQALKMAQEQAFNEDIAERLDAIEAKRNAGSDGSTFSVVKGNDES